MSPAGVATTRGGAHEGRDTVTDRTHAEADTDERRHDDTGGHWHAGPAGGSTVDDAGGSTAERGDHAARWRHVVTDLLAVDRAVVEDVVADSGLLGVQADLLIRLSRRADHRSPMNVLAAAMRVSGSSLTKLVDRLSELGYARRDASEDDRRVVYVVLTEAGVDEGARLRERYAGVLRSRVLAAVGGGAVGLADIARQLA